MDPFLLLPSPWPFFLDSSIFLNISLFLPFFFSLFPNFFGLRKYTGYYGVDRLINYLSSCDSASTVVVLIFIWRCRLSLLLFLSESLHRGREALFLLLGCIRLYYLLSALFTTKWNVSSVHVDVSVPKRFLAKKTRVQEMGLLLFESGIIEPRTRSRRRAN